MSETSMPEIATAVLGLNSPTAPYVYSINGDTITGRWNFANAELATGLSDGGASANFRYVVTLKPEDRTFRCVEQDAGYNRGEVRAYRGYNRNYNVNALSIIVGLFQRADRKQRTGQVQPAHEYQQEAIKAPLRMLLESSGWTRKGLIA